MHKYVIMLCNFILVESNIFFSTDSVSFGLSRTFERLQSKKKRMNSRINNKKSIFFLIPLALKMIYPWKYSLGITVKIFIRNNIAAKQGGSQADGMPVNVTFSILKIGYGYCVIHCISHSSSLVRLITGNGYSYRKIEWLYILNG